VSRVACAALNSLYARALQGVADGLINVTQWPSQLTVSQAWSLDLMEQWGAAMGLEQRLKGTNVMLGPDVNIARVPWSGRVFETMGEDPFLASALVGPLIKGIQSNNISACVKHFVGNNQECNRQTMSANMDERTAREVYLPAFFAAVDVGVGSVMCAFNRINDTFACENSGALGRWLKDESAVGGGFRGWVVTDWGAQHNSIAAAVAGLDQEMEWVKDANFTRYGGIGFANPEFKAAVLNGTVR
jgi:beta-glucosidase